MDRTYLTELRTALSERLAVVGDHELRESDATAHLEKLMKAAARVDELVLQLPADADPMLRHYLERQSYVKAVAWLGERTG